MLLNWLFNDAESVEANVAPVIEWLMNVDQVLELKVTGKTEVLG
jgi:hypothetical protein